MPDTFIDTSSQSWFGRIGGSIKGVLVGLIFVPIAIVLLLWNEGRAVKTANSLKEGAATVVSVPPDPISPANDQKLIHLSGDVAAGEAISDPVFGIGAQALRLVRQVEMYQWKEDSSTDSHKKLGGSEDSQTQVTYTKTWSDKPIDSSRFKRSQDYSNPTSWPLRAATVVCPKTTLGAFKIPAAVIEKMSGDEVLPANQECLAHVPPDWAGKAKIGGDSIFVGNDPSVPAVGDVRVSFKILKPATFSIVAQQTGDTLAPSPTQAGREIELVASGVRSADLMFQDAEKENTLITWAVRAGGFILMFIGFAAILSPLKVLADVIPFAGSIVGFGTGLIALILGFAGSLVVIAIAWLAARPLLGGTLLVVAAAALIHGIMRVRAHHAQRAAGADAS